MRTFHEDFFFRLIFPFSQYFHQLLGRCRLDKVDLNEVFLLPSPQQSSREHFRLLSHHWKFTYPIIRRLPLYRILVAVQHLHLVNCARCRSHTGSEVRRRSGTRLLLQTLSLSMEVGVIDPNFTSIWKFYWARTVNRGRSEGGRSGVEVGRGAV